MAFLLATNMYSHCSGIEKMSTSNIVKMDLHEMRENLLQVAVNESRVGLEELDADTWQAHEAKAIHDGDDDDELIRLAVADDPDHMSADTPEKNRAPMQEDEDLLDLLFERDVSKADEKNSGIDDDELLALAFS